MNKPTQLIVNVNKENTTQSLVIISIMLAMMISGLVYLFNNNLSIIPMFPFVDYLVLLSIKIFLCFGIALFSFGVIFGILSLFDKHPAAILNENGIWIKYYNFVSWKDVVDFDLLPISIGINVINPKVLSKRSNLGGKMGIFWSNLFGYHHINISNVDTSLDKIMNFANRYIIK